MKILYFHQYFTTRQGSGGIRSYEFARYLVDKGHKVTLVYAPSDQSGSIIGGQYVHGIKRGIFDGINLIELNLHYSNKLGFFDRSVIFFKYSIRSVRLAFTEDYDILFATSTPLTAAIPGIIMKLFRKKRFVFEVRDLWPELPRAMGVINSRIVLTSLGILEWLGYRTADACIGLSPGIIEGIQKRRHRKGPVVMIPNASDMDLFYPEVVEKSIIPGCLSDDFIAIFTGSHGIANGLESVVEAAKEVQDLNRYNIKFVFIGDGMKKGSLIESAENKNLKNCIFLSPVSKQKLNHYLNASDIGLMILANIPAFYYGTSPNKFFDYLAVGLPILVNYPGWMSDLVKKNNCGITVEPSDPRDFAEKLIRLSEDKRLLAEMRSNSRILAEKEFNRQHLSAKLEDFLLNL